MVNITQLLKIKPQYVFIFASAAFAIGLLEQAGRASDNLVQLHEPQRTKGQTFMNRILSKLRGS
jgi:hypothetical protein